MRPLRSSLAVAAVAAGALAVPAFASAAPNLVPHDLDLGSASVQAETPIAAKVAVANEGDSAAPASTLTFTTSKGRPIAVAVPRLAAGASRTLKFTARFATSGPQIAEARADARGVVLEGNEEDNLLERQYDVAPAPTTNAPNLFVRDIDLGDKPVQAERFVPVKVTVANDGQGTAEASKLSFTVVGGASQTVNVPRIPSNATRTVRLLTRFPTDGQELTETRVDADQTITETNEEDNLFERAVIVEPLPKTNVEVTVPAMHVFNDLDDDLFNYSAEWTPTLLTVFDPAQSCDLDISVGPIAIQRTIKSFGCSVGGDDDVEDDSDDPYAHPNVFVRAHLGRNLPIVAAVTAFEDDFPLPPDVPGTASINVKSPWAGVPGSFDAPGRGCTKTSITGDPYKVDDGHCFDATFNVELPDTIPTLAPSVDTGDGQAEQATMGASLANLRADVRGLAKRARAQGIDAPLTIAAH